MARKKAKKEEESGFSKMLATTVALGIVFSAGLITGQRLLRAEARAPMVSLSTTRAAPTASTDEGAKPSLRTTFSFYEHLTQDAEATSPPAQSGPSINAAPSAKVEDEKKVVVAPPKTETPAPKPAPAVAAAPVQPVPAKVAPAPAEEAVPVAAAKPAVADVLDEVVGSLSGSVAAKPVAAALPARYTLQVSSHPDRKSAEKEVSRLTQMGVEPHLVVVNVPGRGELWRVRVGKFHSMDEARDFQGSVKSRRGVAGFVTPL